MQYFGRFDMLTVHKCSDIGILRHLSNPAFENFRKKPPLRLIFFSKSFKFYVDSRNVAKKSEIFF